MFVVRLLRDLIGQNIVQPYPMISGVELLAEEVSRDDYAGSVACRGLIGAEWPKGRNVIRVFGEQFANGEVLLVGVEGQDWKIVPRKGA